MKSVYEAPHTSVFNAAYIDRNEMIAVSWIRFEESELLL